MIAKNVLFGGGMYLNDGYLIEQPVARKHLRDDDSLLRVMMATNLIRLLTRERDPVGLCEMPDKMARSGSSSFQELIASVEWSELRPLYKTIAQSIFHSGNNRNWPLFDMSFGFAKLIDGILNRQPHQLGLRPITSSLVSDTRCCREVSSSRLSVGWATALGITVVPTITRSMLDCLSSPSLRPASIVAISIISTPSSPTRTAVRPPASATARVGQSRLQSASRTTPRSAPRPLPRPA